MARAHVGLGANLGEREETLRRALELIAETAGTEVVAVSSFRETDPVGYLDQPRFLNAAAELETSLSPRGLLEALLAVERELGRTREGARFGPRTVDLDLLLYDAVQLDVVSASQRRPAPASSGASRSEPLAELTRSSSCLGKRAGPASWRS